MPSSSSIVSGMHSAWSARDSRSNKPKLPLIQPHVNRRAQEIIAAHMESVSTLTCTNASLLSQAVPVLKQLEGTAPKTAKTHDISHICDTVHVLTPRVPESMIDEKDHVYEATFMPEGPLSVYNDSDGMWYTKVFPSANPSSRMSAIHLDDWITKKMSEKNTELPGAKHSKDDLAATVDCLVPVLSKALHEVARQVTYHCSERGSALTKIWTVYVELFQRVLNQMQKALQDQRARTADLQADLNAAKNELDGLKKSHPADMYDVITKMETNFDEQQIEYDTLLEKTHEENERLEVLARVGQEELDSWYPGFDKYKDSYIRHHVPDVDPGKVAISVEDAKKSPNANASSPSRGQVFEEMNADVAIAKDFKRLLAVLAPDKRKAIGQELSGVMDRQATVGHRSTVTVAKRNTKGPDIAKFGHNPGSNSANADAFKQIRDEVHSQEARIRELREAILKLEMQQLSGSDPYDHGGKDSADQLLYPAFDGMFSGVFNTRATFLHARVKMETQTEIDAQGEETPIVILAAPVS